MHSSEITGRSIVSESNPMYLYLILPFPQTYASSLINLDTQFWHLSLKCYPNSA